MQPVNAVNNNVYNFTFCCKDHINDISCLVILVINIDTNLSIYSKGKQFVVWSLCHL